MTNPETSEAKLLKEKLSHNGTRLWDVLSEDEKAQVFTYADEYRKFLDSARTERRTIGYIARAAAAAGFKELGDGPGLPGKVIFQQHGKIAALAVRGRSPLTEGVRLITSHVDCPRLDLKVNPLYEDTALAYLKTHYYGGVKKYQWLARPLALVGAAVLSDGRQVDIEIGLAADDPVFTITDLLPHLARKQMDHKASEFVPAETLNVLLGGLPYPDKDAEDRVKLALLELLNNRYGLVEQDLVTAELQIVPADSPRDCGLDRAFIAAYGHDDRICAYTSLTALLATEEPEHTAVAVFYDKEEIGSEGNTSAKSNFLEHFLLLLLEAEGTGATLLNLHKTLNNIRALSADVTAGIDPNYPDVFDKRNTAKLGHGIGLKKYTGHGGKYAASDANAEYAGWLRRLFNEHGVVWQIAGIGKVDEGGGGTVSKYLANMGAEIIDCGPPILGMHSPFEVAAKDDLWMCQKAFHVFFGS